MGEMSDGKGVVKMMLNVWSEASGIQGASLKGKPPTGVKQWRVGRGKRNTREHDITATSQSVRRTSSEAHASGKRNASRLQDTASRFV